MQRMAAHVMGVERGSIMLFSDFKDGGVMLIGQGPCEVRRVVESCERFLSPLVAHVWLSMWVVDLETTSASSSRPTSSTRKASSSSSALGADTRITRVRADWIAIGGASSDDDREVI